MTTAFNLKPGIVYAAIQNGKRTTRKFRLDEGVLENNASGSFSDCTFIPLTPDLEFRPVGIEKNIQVNLLQFEENVEYKDDTGYYVRRGNLLYQRKGKKEFLVEQNFHPNYDGFTPVKILKKSKKLA